MSIVDEETINKYTHPKIMVLLGSFTKSTSMPVLMI